MGQSESHAAAPATKVEPFDPVVEVVKNKHFNAHYGEVKVVRDTKTDKEYILKEVVINTKQAFEAEVEAIKKRIALSSPHVVNIVGYTTQEKSNFCSTNYKVSIYIEVLEKTLENELQERQKESHFYTETEILSIADSLVSGLSFFQAQGFSHDDIRTSNIFVNEKTYKLTDPFLNAQKDSNGLTFAIINGIKTPLAPELIPQVPKQQFEIKTDRNTADVYSLGVTLLSLGTLTSHEELYDHKEGTIDQTLLQGRIDALRRRYSHFTCDLIESMLTVDTEKRPNFASLSNTLLPYQSEIREGSAIPIVRAEGGETVKRAHYVVDTLDHDDLEARIKAALERSAETFKAVAARDGLPVDHYNTPSTTTYNYTTYTANPTSYYNVPTDKVVEIVTTKETEIVKSSVPQDVTEQKEQPGHYTDLVNLKTSGYLHRSQQEYNYIVQGNAETNKETAPQETTTTKVQEYSYTPSTYTYTYNAEKVEEAPVKATTTTNVQEYTVPATYTTGTAGLTSDLSAYNPGTSSVATYSYTTTTYNVSGTGETGTEVKPVEGGNTYSYNYTSPYTAEATTTYTYTSSQVGGTTVQEGERKEEAVVNADVNVNA